MSVLGRPTWAIFDVNLHQRVTALDISPCKHMSNNYPINNNKYDCVYSYYDRCDQYEFLFETGVIVWL